VLLFFNDIGPRNTYYILYSTYYIRAVYMRRGHGNKRVFIKYFIFNARKNVPEVRLLNCTRILHT